MDPISLATGAVALLIPFLAQMGGRVAEHMGDALARSGPTMVEQLYQRVRARVTGEPYAEQALQRLEQQPDNDRRQRAFEDALADLLQAEPAFAEDIRRLVEDASHITQTNYTQITDAGTVAVEGDVNLRGTYVAGRDLTAGPAAEDSER
jgi:hypothetical protein